MSTRLTPLADDPSVYKLVALRSYAVGRTGTSLLLLRTEKLEFDRLLLVQEDSVSLRIRTSSLIFTECDIKVMHKSVSRLHAQLDLVAGPEGQRLLVKDLSKVRYLSRFCVWTISVLVLQG